MVEGVAIWWDGGKCGCYIEVEAGMLGHGISCSSIAVRGNSSKRGCCVEARCKVGNTGIACVENRRLIAVVRWDYGADIDSPYQVQVGAEAWCWIEDAGVMVLMIVEVIDALDAAYGAWRVGRCSTKTSNTKKIPYPASRLSCCILSTGGWLFWRLMKAIYVNDEVVY